MATFTHKGQALIADLMAQGKALNIDQVIFANIPELDPSAEVDQHSGKPAADLIVHESGIYRASFVNQDSVVYSAFLDSSLGFTFNWFGLYCTEHETLIALEYTEPQNKVKTENGIYGNNLTKNFVIKFSGAKTLANIEIPAESWQLNFADQVDELYQRTEQASEQRLGIISVATLEEIRAGDSAIKAITPKYLKPFLEEFKRYSITQNDIGLSKIRNYPIVHDPEQGGPNEYASGAAVRLNLQAARYAQSIGKDARTIADKALESAEQSIKSVTLYDDITDGILPGPYWKYRSTSELLPRACFVLVALSFFGSNERGGSHQVHGQMIPAPYLERLTMLNRGVCVSLQTSPYNEAKVTLARDSNLLEVSLEQGTCKLSYVVLFYL